MHQQRIHRYLEVIGQYRQQGNIRHGQAVFPFADCLGRDIQAFRQGFLCQVFCFPEFFQVASEIHFSFLSCGVKILSTLFFSCRIPRQTQEKNIPVRNIVQLKVEKGEPADQGTVPPVRIDQKNSFRFQKLFLPEFLSFKFTFLSIH